MVQLVMAFIFPQSQYSRKKGGPIYSDVRFWNNECPHLMIWYCNDFLRNDRSIGEVCLLIYNFRQMTHASSSASTAHCWYACICQ